MRYLGGKSKTRTDIAAYLNRIRKPGQPYWEPFVGAGWVLEKIRGQPIYASDANYYLIDMWIALQGGWIPPKVVTEEMHKKAQQGIYDNPLTAFIMFGCSFGGKWGGGYARGKDDNGKSRNYARESSQMLLQKMGRSSPAQFFTADFNECNPPEYGCLIYCDPPYKDTTAYGATGKFDTDAFWRRVRWLEEHGHTVVVSEYKAPSDFSVVWEMNTKLGLKSNGDNNRTERMFRVGQHVKLQPDLFAYAGLEV